jgi:hypothetical protein
MKKNIAHNLVKSWKTTVIGLVVLAAALTSIFIVDNINWFDASIGVGIGLALMFSPDSILKRISSLISKNNNTPCDPE